MDIALRPEVEKLIENEVRAGRSAGPSEFVDKAVYHYLVARELNEEYRRDIVEEKIDRGLAQAQRGETVDSDEFFEQLRRRCEEFRRRR